MSLSIPIHLQILFSNIDFIGAAKAGTKPCFVLMLTRCYGLYI